MTQNAFWLVTFEFHMWFLCQITYSPYLLAKTQEWISTDWILGSVQLHFFFPAYCILTFLWVPYFWGQLLFHEDFLEPIKGSTHCFCVKILLFLLISFTWYQDPSNLKVSGCSSVKHETPLLGGKAGRAGAGQPGEEEAAGRS